MRAKLPQLRLRGARPPRRASGMSLGEAFLCGMFAAYLLVALVFLLLAP